jgi:very-short-patch-repair endonuclease
MLSETDLSTVIVLPNIGKITVKDALAKDLLELPHYNSYGKTYEEIYGVKKAKELRETHSKAMKKSEVRTKISKAMIGRKIPWMEGKTYEEIYGVERAKELKECRSKAKIGKNLGKHTSTEFKIGHEMSAEVREKIREAAHRKHPWMGGDNSPMRRPEVLKKWFESNNIKPNKLERRCNNLLQIICPNEFKYTGNGGFILGGKCPDFMNVNGKKKLIELYGDYWHDKKYFPDVQTPQERVDFFKKYGYDCLIIWEYEIWGEITEVVRKVLMFIGRNPEEIIIQS